MVWNNPAKVGAITWLLWPSSFLMTGKPLSAIQPQLASRSFQGRGLPGTPYQPARLTSRQLYQTSSLTQQTTQNSTNSHVSLWVKECSCLDSGSAYPRITRPGYRGWPLPEQCRMTTRLSLCPTKTLAGRQRNPAYHFISYFLLDIRSSRLSAIIYPT
jgi:hypothetical protein